MSTISRRQAEPQQPSGTNYAPCRKPISPSPSLTLQPIPATAATNTKLRQEITKETREMVRLIQTSFAVIPLIPSTDPARLRVLPIHPTVEPQDSSRLRTPLCPSHSRHLPLVITIQQLASPLLTHPPVFASSTQANARHNTEQQPKQQYGRPIVPQVPRPARGAPAYSVGVCHFHPAPGSIGGPSHG